MISERSCDTEVMMLKILNNNNLTTVKLQYYHLRMLMEFLLFLSFYFGGNPQEALSASFVDNSRFINYSHYEFGKVFVAHITLSHSCLIKINTNLTEQLTSNSFSTDLPRALNFEPWVTSLCRAVRIQYM